MSAVEAIARAALALCGIIAILLAISSIHVSIKEAMLFKRLFSFRLLQIVDLICGVTAVVAAFSL